MPRVGPYGIPFPYEPYALQTHAMTTLRAFLDKAKHNNNEREAEEVRVAVLESPTGTGKSQMLLNAVLSHLFDIASPATVCDEDALQAAATILEGEACAVGAKRERTTDMSGSSPCQGLTLQEALARQRVEDERRTRRMERRRRARRQARAKALAAAQHKAINGGSNNTDGEEEDNLILQTADTTMLDSAGSSSAYEDALLGSDNSSDEDVVSSSSSDNDEGEDDAGEMALAVMVPLRQPKVYFASRTHTQLQQLFEDFGKTDFATHPVTYRAANSAPENNKQHIDNNNTAHRLRAVHLASRQHLCINATLRRRAQRQGGGTEALNELCVEAMRYEQSAEGRAARKAAMKDERAGVTRLTSRLSMAAAGVLQDTPLVNEEDEEDWSSVADIEEYGNNSFKAKASSEADGVTTSMQDKGCAFCASHRLRAFLTHLQQLTRETENNKSNNECATTPSLTLTQMYALGRQLQACPYLVSRLLVRGADVVFVPYNYLMDETQRSGLLGGAATNAVTPHELAAMDEAANSASETTTSKTVSTSANSLASVLYRRQHRYQRMGTTTTSTAGDKQQTLPCKAGSGMSALDALCTEQAMCQPPRFLGDLLVLDEAHNVVDHCRSLSTASMTLNELRLVRALVLYYLQRYEMRLLTVNKEYLRRLAWFCERLAAPPLDAISSVQCVSFTSWLFDRGIDHVDVYPLLLFLSDSHLCVKLHGLVSSALRSYAQAGTGHTAVSNSGITKAWQGVMAQLVPTVCKDNKENTQSSTTPSHTVRHLSHQSNAVEGVVPCNALTEANVAQALRLVSRALRRMTHFLRWYYYSDTTTQVLLEPTLTAGERQVQIKLVQLEPGRHTLYPIFRDVNATVLAGGTMQPLSLTCAPLLPIPTVDSSYNMSASSPCEAVCLIREGHVVPASAVTVWALGVGPNKRRMEFSYQALQGADNTTMNSVSLGVTALWTELACTLLNLARVLPAAGAICFFTSHEVQHRFVHFLRTTTYYDEINRVKRLFIAEEDENGNGPTKTHASAEAVQRMLEAYKAHVLPSTSSSSTTGNSRGALLFTVMGGRLAEGINFADDLARAVLVIGLPFANANDPVLQLHLRHVAQTRLGNNNNSTTRNNELSSDGRIASAALDAGHMSAAEWGLYTDLCMRVVNQCIGRCIRHAKDYAAIVLLDARYAERADIRRRISAWLQPSLHVANNFGDCFRGVRDFFAAHA